MPDTLRDRIAAVLKAVLSEQAYTLTLNDKEPMSVIVDGEVDLLDMADAVIEALDSQGWLVAFPSPDEPGWLNDESRCLRGDDDA